jgi:hypothetical protein
MPRHHSPDQKAAALQCLDSNGGDIVTTAVQTGIPERTLYTWRKELWIQRVKRQQSLPPPPPIEIPHFDNDIDSLIYIRGQVLKFIKAISEAIWERMPTHANSAWMMDRIRAQNGLVTILLKLNAYLKPHLDRRNEDAAAFPVTIRAWSDWNEDQLGDEPADYDPYYGNARALN